MYGVFATRLLATIPARVGPTLHSSAVAPQLSRGAIWVDDGQVWRCDLPFQSRQWRVQAKMRTMAEGEMPITWPCDVQPIGVFELCSAMPTDHPKDGHSKPASRHANVHKKGMGRP